MSTTTVNKNTPPPKSELFDDFVMIENTSPASAVYSKTPKDTAPLKNLQSTPVEQFLLYITAANAHPEAMKDLAPVGITNIANDCWANAILQFIVNAPGIARKILGYRNGACREFALQLQNYYEAQIQAKPLSDICSQQLRKDLLPGSWLAQEDALDGLQSILSKAKCGFQVYDEFYVGEHLFEERVQETPELMLHVNMQENTSFTDLFNTYFAPEFIEGDGRIKKTKFESAPKDLIIHAKRYGDRHDLVIDAIPETFELPSEFTRWNEPDVHYELTGCIIHTGKDNKGHYITIEKKPDGWYRVDGPQVTPISAPDAYLLMRTGYIFHYNKLQLTPAKKETKPARTCGNLLSSISSVAQPVLKIAYYPFQIARQLTGIGW